MDCGVSAWSKSTEDDHRSGRPVDVCADENVRHVNDMITTDRRLHVRYVAACLKLSYGTTHQSIMLLPSRWVTTRCVLDGCRECRRRRKSKSVWPLHMKISVCTTQIQRGFSADMSPWTRLGRSSSRDQAAEQAVEACHFADASKVSQDCLCWQSWRRYSGIVRVC